MKSSHLNNSKDHRFAGRRVMPPDAISCGMRAGRNDACALRECTDRNRLCPSIGHHVGFLEKRR